MPDPGEREGAPGSAGDEPPPFLARWSRIYLLVGGLLVAQILAFGLLRWWAS